MLILNITFPPGANLRHFKGKNENKPTCANISGHQRFDQNQLVHKERFVYLYTRPVTDVINVEKGQASVTRWTHKACVWRQRGLLILLVSPIPLLRAGQSALGQCALGQSGGCTPTAENPQGNCRVFSQGSYQLKGKATTKQYFEDVLGSKCITS